MLMLHPTMVVVSLPCTHSHPWLTLKLHGVLVPAKHAYSHKYWPEIRLAFVPLLVQCVQYNLLGAFVYWFILHQLPYRILFIVWPPVSSRMYRACKHRCTPFYVMAVLCLSLLLCLGNDPPLVLAVMSPELYNPACCMKCFCQ